MATTSGTPARTRFRLAAPPEVVRNAPKKKGPAAGGFPGAAIVFEWLAVIDTTR